MSLNRYDGLVDLDDVRYVYGKISQRVAPGSRVLDIGCATGNLALALTVERQCSVLGIEVDPEAVLTARGKGLDVCQADIATLPLGSVVGDQRFDAVLLADVLEHLLSPEEVLAQVPGLLANDGEALVSIPNITHVDTILMLAQDRWTYRATGLLDETHVRFFTMETFGQMARRCGLEVVSVDPVLVPVLETELLEGSEASTLTESQLNGILQIVKRTNRNALTYQHVFALRPTGGGRGAARSGPVDAEPTAEHGAKDAGSPAPEVPSLLVLARERDQLQQRLGVVQRERDLIHHKLEVVLNSRSWRVTRPLRRWSGSRLPEALGPRRAKPEK